MEQNCTDWNKTRSCILIWNKLVHIHSSKRNKTLQNGTTLFNLDQMEHSYSNLKQIITHVTKNGTKLYRLEQNKQLYSDLEQINTHDS